MELLIGIAFGIGLSWMARVCEEEGVVWREGQILANLAMILAIIYRTKFSTDISVLGVFAQITKGPRGAQALSGPTLIYLGTC